MTVEIESEDQAYERRVSFGKWALRNAGVGMHVYNPYHNTRHAECMMDFAIRAWVYTLPHLPQPAELVLAAAFHDYDHTGGHQPDSINIELALNGFNARLSHPRVADLYSPGFVERLIQVTEYDAANRKFKYAHPNELLSNEHSRYNEVLAAECLRDADVLSAIMAPDAAQQLFGLYREIFVTHPDMGPGDFLKLNSEFLRTTPLFTSYARQIRTRYLAERLQAVAAAFAQSVSMEQQQ